MTSASQGHRGLSRSCLCADMRFYTARYALARLSVSILQAMHHVLRGMRCWVGTTRQGLKALKTSEGSTLPIPAARRTVHSLALFPRCPRHATPTCPLRRRARRSNVGRTTRAALGDGVWVAPTALFARFSPVLTVRRTRSNFSRWSRVAPAPLLYRTPVSMYRYLKRAEDRSNSILCTSGSPCF